MTSQQHPNITGHKWKKRIWQILCLFSFLIGLPVLAVLLWYPRYSVIDSNVSLQKRVPGCIVFSEYDSVSAYSCGRKTSVELVEKAKVKPINITEWLWSTPSPKIAYWSSMGLEHNVGILQVNVKEGRLFTEDSHVSQMDIDPESCTYSGDSFYGVEGHGQRVELVSRDHRGKVKREKLPDTSSKAGTQGEWNALPSIYDGSHLAYAESTGKGKVTIVDRVKETSFIIGTGSDPVWSSDGKRLAYIPKNQPTKKLVISVFDTRIRNTTDVLVWKPRGLRERINWPIDQWDLPNKIVRLCWIPETELILCEVEPVYCGDDYLFVVDVKTGERSQMPFMVSRQAWAWFAESTH